MISGRHIRHDYKTWVDWEQVSVRTMCGTTTRSGLAGIPGITPQDKIVQKGDKSLWGWCWPCVREAYPEMIRVLAAFETMNVNLATLYIAGVDELREQYVRSEKRFGYRRRGADVVQ